MYKVNIRWFPEHFSFSKANVWQAQQPTSIILFISTASPKCRYSARDGEEVGKRHCVVDRKTGHKMDPNRVFLSKIISKYMARTKTRCKILIMTKGMASPSTSHNLTNSSQRHISWSPKPSEIWMEAILSPQLLHSACT